MFLKKYNLIYFLISLVLFSACEKDAENVDIPVVQPQLVVHSYISPQAEAIVVWVGMSKPIFGQNTGNTPYIDDATVKISDGVTLKDVPYNVMYNHYRADTNTFKIIPGKTYTLYVSSPDGKNVKATCTVPFPPDAASMEADFDTSVKRTANELDYRLNTRFKWRDVPGQADYYHTFIEVKLVQHPDTSFKSYTLFSQTGELYSDKGNDGKIMTTLSSEYHASYFSQSGLVYFDNPEGIKYHLLRVDENYYKYHISAQSNNNSDPFSEPVTMHTNIENGLGCFGAFYQVSDSLDF